MGEHPPVSAREREVLRLLAQGYTNREIAQVLCVSVKTVDRHKENVMNKLHLRNRTELLLYALRESAAEQPSSPVSSQ